MVMNKDWRFEPCDPEGERSPYGIDYTHATRGTRPAAGAQGRVMGFGFSQAEADKDCHDTARRFDGWEAVGAQG